jgi:glutathione S-transferase
MRLYDYPGAPNPRRVRIFMAEKGVEIETIRVDLAVKEQFSPAYRAINARCLVPTLVLDDGTAIDESVAICRYLEEVFPEPPLMGVDARDKALVEMWQRRMELDGLAAAAEALRNSAKGLQGRALVGPHGYEQIPALVARGKARLVDFYADLDARLAESAYVAGDRFTIADITAFVTIEFATSRMKLGFAPALRAIARWRAMVEARPSMRIQSAI